MFLNLLNAANGILSIFSDYALSSKLFRIFTIGLGAAFGLGLTLTIGIVYGMHSLRYYYFLRIIFRYFGILALGAVIYSTHVPEIFFASVFDTFGQSHNWWHFFAALAVASLFDGWLKFIQQFYIK